MWVQYLPQQFCTHFTYSSYVAYKFLCSVHPDFIPSASDLRRDRASDYSTPYVIGGEKITFFAPAEQRQKKF